MGKSGRELLDERIAQVWTVHLHNQWNKRFPEGGWMDKLFERYALRLDLIKKGRSARTPRGGEIVADEQAPSQ